MVQLERVLLSAVLALTVHCTSNLPNGGCSINGQMCEMHVDNIITIVPNIATLTECRVLCHDDLNCSYITYYGANSFPFSETCILLSACSFLRECLDCISEDNKCLRSSSVEIHLGDNLLQFLEFNDEWECLAACNPNIGCNFYTFYDLSDPTYPGACFLLSRLQGPVRACEYCKTGSAFSSNNCFFLMNEEISSNGILFTNTSSPISHQLIALGPCEITILAVGGGGYGKNAGGGSGFVEWISYNFTGTHEIEVTVGTGQQKSVVMLDGEVLVEAEPGEDHHNYFGGAGYSGGGGDGDAGNGSGGQGGTDGGDGEDAGDGVGGKGSGVKVVSIPVKGFMLTPGLGGLAVSNDDDGGGGGGVLIDGIGPAGGTQSDGQGYGGGGSHYVSGKSGAVIISFNLFP